MQVYQCSNCQGIFCGWSIKYKYKYKCPNCGGDLQEVYSDSKKKLAKGNLGKKEFEEMCKKAGVKKEALCETVFTRQFKEIGQG